MSNINVVFFENVSKSFGQHQVLSNISFEIEKDGIYSLIGKSGSGKTTALRLMNGLIYADQGLISIFGENIRQLDGVNLRKKMGYVIQGAGLFPHLTLLENVSLVARRVGWSKAKCYERSLELLELVNLSPREYLNKKVYELSGGQRQRVGIVRALFLQPQLILMDEPFGALDPITRDDIQDEFLQLQKKIKFTAIIVTHDLSEAFKLSNQILVLNNGNLDQKAKPSELLSHPQTPYVETLISRFKKSLSFDYV